MIRPAGRRSVAQCDVAPVVSEQFVAAGSRHADFDIAMHELKDIPGRHPPTVRLIQIPHHFEQVTEQIIGLQDQLMMVGPPALRYLSRQRQFIERGSANTDKAKRVRLELSMTTLSKQTHNAGGIQSA